MSKRVSNKKSSARKGKVFARQTVRLGWRKRRAREIIAAAKQQMKLDELTKGVQA